MDVKKLRCDNIREGLFTNESVITVQELGNGEVEFTVPSDLVADHYVEVRVFERSGNPWVVIPSEYQDSIPVDGKLLEPA